MNIKEMFLTSPKVSSKQVATLARVIMTREGRKPLPTEEELLLHDNISALFDWLNYGKIWLSKNELTKQEEELFNVS